MRTSNHLKEIYLQVGSSGHKLSRAKDPNIRFKHSDDFKRDWTSDGKMRAAFAYYGITYTIRRAFSDITPSQPSPNSAN
jgi:hypothetical protein